MDTIKCGSVLIVDDDSGWHSAFSRKLRQRYDICFAKDLTEARELLVTRDEIWLVLLDYRLGVGETGLMLLREIREQRLNVRVIITTGSHSSTLKEETVMREGADGFLRKPHEDAELFRLIDEVPTRYLLRLRLATLLRQREGALVHSVAESVNE